MENNVGIGAIKSAAEAVARTVQMSNPPKYMDYIENKGVFEADYATRCLMLALQNLTGMIPDNTMKFVFKSQEITEIMKAKTTAEYLADYFNDVNPSLETAWFNVAKFAESINEMVAEKMKKFAVELNAFIETTQSNESGMEQAVNNTNNAAEQILKELQSSFDLIS